MNHVWLTTISAGMHGCIAHAGWPLSNSPPTWCERTQRGRPSKGEYQYGEAEGRQVLTDMFTEAGFDDLEIESFTIHQEQPLYWHADVLVGSGIKKH